MRLNLTLTLGSFCLLTSFANGQGKPHKVQGGGSSPQSIKFQIDREYCSERTAYTYDDAGVTLGIKNSAAKTTDAISDLAHFEDPGGTIISPTEKANGPGQTSLMSDGSDASRLLARAFFSGPCTTQQPIRSTGSQPAKLLSAKYYIINIVSWNHISSGGKTSYQIESNEWYVFNTSDKSVVRQTPFRTFHPMLTNDSRIYGSKAIGFLAVHLKPQDTTPQDFAQLQIVYNVSIKEKQAINVQDLVTLLQVIAGGAGAGRTPEEKPQFSANMVGLYGGGLIGAIQKLPDDITFDANVVFPQPTIHSANGVAYLRDYSHRDFYHPVKYRDTEASIGVYENPDQPAQKTSASVAQGSADQPKASVTCDQALDQKTNAQSPCSFSKTYDDEGLYHWDVSVGVPVKALKALQYSSTDGSVTAKDVSRLNAYGFFDIYPRATDLKSPPAFGWPHFIVGLPFSGKVFNKPFFGSGGVIGFQQIPKVGPALSKIIPVKFNFYGGVVYNKEFRPATLAIGSPASPGAVANNLVPHRVWKGQFGIEFSIRDVKDKLTPAKKNAAAGSDPTKSSGTPKS